MSEALGGVAGTALWLTQSAWACRPVTPPPALTHFDKATRHVSATVEYANGQKLDIWQPRDLSTPAPVLLYIPGGGWMLGHRRGQGHALLSRLVDEGWICVSIDYRTAPQHRWPAHFIDVKEALWWITTNIENYGGDPDGVLAVAGASAGGHMAALAGLAWDSPAYSSVPGVRPDAVIPLYGVYDWTFRGSPYHDGFVRILESAVVGKRQGRHPEIFIDASPIKHVRPDAPPFLIIHGQSDWLTPVGGARRFRRKLSEVSECVEYQEFPGAGHAFDLTNPTATKSAVTVITNFLDRVRNKDLVAA